MKKIILSSEIIYLVAIALLSLAVAALSAADFGISMIVAPAYLLSLKTNFLTFGQAEYVIQAGVFIVLCLVLKKFKFIYLFSFGTCLLYGFVLDMWRKLPLFDPQTTPPGSRSLTFRIILFLSGIILTSFSVALFFKTYLYPQVYDFSVKAISRRYGIRLPILKTIVDLTCLTTSFIMTLTFFGKIRGIGWGTVIMALVNGTLIGFFSNLLDRIIEFRPIFRKFSLLFVLQPKNETTK